MLGCRTVMNVGAGIIPDPGDRQMRMSVTRNVAEVTINIVELHGEIVSIL